MPGSLLQKPPRGPRFSRRFTPRPSRPSPRAVSGGCLFGGRGGRSVAGPGRVVVFEAELRAGRDAGGVEDILECTRGSVFFAHAEEARVPSQATKGIISPPLPHPLAAGK